MYFSTHSTIAILSNYTTLTNLNFLKFRDFFNHVIVSINYINDSNKQRKYVSYQV